MSSHDKSASREQRAIDAVKAVTPDGRKFKVTGTIDNVLDGTLLFVEFEHDIDVWNEKYALFRADSVTVISNSQQLAIEFSHAISQPAAIRLLRLLAEPSIMAALITILIVIGAILFMTLTGTATLPT